jgi:hypothetical protein
MQPCGLPSFHEVRRRIVDLVMLALAGAAFRSEYATTVDILEIPIGKLIAPLVFSGFSPLTPKCHLPYSTKPWRRMYSLSSKADGWCSLHASRSSNAILRYARWLSGTVMNVLLFQSSRIRI